MKNSLGSFLFLITLFPIIIQASTYSWNTFVSKEKLYVGESVYLKYTCEFDDHGELYIIDFKAPSNELYDLALFRHDVTLKNGKRINTFEYILKAKVAQKLEVTLEAIVKKTSLDSIIDSTTNHYDDTKFDSIHEEVVVKMDTVSLTVLSSPKKLVGTFELHVEKDEPQIKAYEPYHLDIKVSGQGNFDTLKAISYSIKGVRTFTQNPTKSMKLDKNGHIGNLSQQFAFISDKDFTIPSKKIEYFDTSSQEVKILKIDSIHVKVKQVYKKSELLDEVEEDLPSSFFEEKVEYLYFLLLFMSGFLVGKIDFKKKKLNNKDEKLITKIKATKSLNQLSILLILENEKKFIDVLNLIDSEELTSLSKTKKILIKDLNAQ